MARKRYVNLPSLEEDEIPLSAQKFFADQELQMVLGGLFQFTFRYKFYLRTKNVPKEVIDKLANDIATQQELVENCRAEIKLIDEEIKKQSKEAPGQTPE